MVSLLQRSFSTLQYYTGSQNGVLITEVPTFPRFVIEGSHCIGTYSSVTVYGLVQSPHPLHIPQIVVITATL